ncbi:hypothetical protein BSKO_12820 [Bryopsis sp. KO-2023]|nr:hypothetical protein BSKO_12820 [Bryopsis sp. KO-2023]
MEAFELGVKTLSSWEESLEPAVKQLIMFYASSSTLANSHTKELKALRLEISDLKETIRELRRSIQGGSSATGTGRGMVKPRMPGPFTGKDKTRLDDWAFSMRQFFAASGVGCEERMVNVASTNLGEDAAICWRLDVEGKTAARQDVVKTWAEFVALLKQQFSVADEEGEARRKLVALRQDAWSRRPVALNFLSSGGGDIENEIREQLLADSDALDFLKKVQKGVLKGYELKDGLVLKHGVPGEVISDRDPRLVGAPWQDMIRGLGIKQNMSSPDHPETDGQTERVNRVINEYLRNFVGGTEVLWPTYLPFCEFAYNSSLHESTGMSPFRFLTGEDVSAPFTKGLRVVLAKAGCSRFRAETSEAMLNRMRDEFRWAQSNLEAARARVAYYADQGRSEEIFSVGQKVLVKASVVRGRLQASTDKLGAKFYGPVPIVQVLSDVVYKVKFPSQVKLCLGSSRKKPKRICWDDL